MSNKTQNQIIKDKFRHGLSGIITNSGGWDELFWTKFNFWSFFLACLLTAIYAAVVTTNELALKLIDMLISNSMSMLGGIVGLSLAGLTLVITFGNPEVIARSSKKQSQQFREDNDFDVSYFQRAIAKFAFFVVSTIRTMHVKTGKCVAYWTNIGTFWFGTYLLLFCLILVLASVLNLFTFSQTSNFFNFMKYVSNPDIDSSEPTDENSVV